MNKNEMLNELIRKWGFEHCFVVAFATLMEDKLISDSALTELYRGLMDF